MIEFRRSRIRHLRTPICLAAVVVVAACTATAPSPSVTPSRALSSPTAATPASSAAPPTAVPTPTATPRIAGVWKRVAGNKTIESLQFVHVAWTGEKFVADGQATDGPAVFVESVDGVTWRAHRLKDASAHADSLGVGPLGVIALGSINDDIGMWSSADGSVWTWHPHAFPAPRSLGNATFDATGVIWTAGQWLAVGREDPFCQFDCGDVPVRALVWTSDDGVRWTAIADQPSLSHAGMNTVARFGSMYVAGGIADRRPALWTSPDGKTWTRVDGIARGIAGGAKGPASSAITGVAANDDAVIAIGMDAQSDEPGASTVRAWVSRDGVAWTTARGERFANGQVFSAATTPDGFIATGPSGGDSCRGGIWESTDGTSWKCVASAAAFEGFSPYAAAASPSVTVAVGFDGATDLPDGFPGAVWRKAAP